MKLSETLMTVLITILGVLPFIWFTYIGKKAAAKSKKTIKNLIKRENLNFNLKEYWNHNFIGIDDARSILVFIKIKSPENDIVKIDLNEVKSCRIDKKTKDFKRDKKLVSELQKMDLELVFGNNQPNITLNFYDIDDRLSEDFEMKRAEKWHNFITESINKQKQKDVAA